MYLVLILVLPFIGSLISAFLPASQRVLQTSVAVVVATLCTVCTLFYLPSFLSGEIPVATAQWIPAHDLNFSLRLDGFARSEEHTSELQSRGHLVCRLL